MVLCVLCDFLVCEQFIAFSQSSRGGVKLWAPGTGSVNVRAQSSSYWYQWALLEFALTMYLFPSAWSLCWYSTGTMLTSSYILGLIYLEEARMMMWLRHHVSSCRQWVGVKWYHVSVPKGIIVTQTEWKSGLVSSADHEQRISCRRGWWHQKLLEK